MRALILTLLAVAAIAVGAVVVIWYTGPAGTLRASFDSAVNVVSGQEVRIAGSKVGKVGSVREQGGRALVELELQDSAWPLRRGTRARLRVDSLSTYSGRFVELSPGPRHAPALPDGGVLSAASTRAPVEFDRILNTYDRPTRRNLQGLLGNAADTVSGHGDDIARGLEQGSVGVQRLADLTADLGEDPNALGLLVRSGAHVSAALRSRDRELGGTVDHAAATMDELSNHTRAQQATLDRFPRALIEGRRLLDRLDRSLVNLRALGRDLRPGVRSLRATAPSLERTTATLAEVAPRATATLRTGRRAAPRIDRFLKAGTPFVPRLTKVVDQLAPMVGCVRPYAPEIAGLFSTWLSGASAADYPVPYARLAITQQPPGADTGTNLDSKQIVEANGDRLSYAMPRPPGLNAGQPWFMPQCGAGRDALDPSKDPEGGGR